ncbi:GNAT family N-acetyltransferase, partial [Vibrio parahaemolyticus]|nr:GNAT family N-acetyltransferase [Vibrio parahaemolyticus]
MKDQHDKRTGNLLATPNAIRQARFAEQQRAMGRKAASTPPITLRLMTERDLPMLHDWLNRPHIVEWWGGDEE